MSSVTLTLSSAGDQLAHLTVTPTLAQGATLLKAMIVIANETDRPKVLNVVDVPKYLEAGIEIPAKPYFTNLAAGTAQIIPFTNLHNGSKHTAKFQMLVKSGNTTSVVESSAVAFTPSGAASAPSILSTVADPTDDAKFTVRIARHASDGGSHIQNVIFYLSKPDDGKGTEINNILTKIVDYSSMYTQNPVTKEYPQWFEATFGGYDAATQTYLDGIEADSNYEITAVFQNATALSAMSEPVMSKSRNTPNAATALVGSGADGQVTVNGTSPNNNFVAPIRGLIVYDQNVIEDDRLAPVYYSFDGTSFTKTVDLDSMSAGFPLKDSEKFSFVISSLLNNVMYSFKVNFVSTNGKGDESAAFSVKAKKAPSAPNKAKVARYTPSSAVPAEAPDASTLSGYQAALDSTSRYARVMALKFTWEDPLEDWATSSTKYTSSLVSADVKTAAIEAALIRFVQPANIAGSDDQRTNAEKLLSNDTVLANITNIANTVSLTQWTGYNASQKSSVCGGSVQMLAAMTLFFAMVNFVKTQSDAAPIIINDDATASQEWSRVVYTLTGATVKHSVTASIVDGTALITSPAAVIETGTADAIADAAVNIATATAKNGDVELVLDRMLKPLGWTGVVYNILVTSSSGQQSVTYTPAYDTYGYAKKSTIMLARDLAVGLTNGVAVTLSVGTEALVDPISGNLVNLSRTTSSSVTPVGKAVAPTFSTVVDQLNLRMQIKKPVLNGAALDKMQFALVREQDLPAAQAATMSESQLETYYTALPIGSKLEFGSTTAAPAGSPTGVNDGLASGEYRAGYDYLISNATFQANLTALPKDKVNHGHSMNISAADGKIYYVLSRVTSTTASSSSDFAVSEPFSFYSAPSDIDANKLSVKNVDGSLAANWEIPSNDGFGSALGLKIINYIVELFSGGVKLQTYTSTTNSFNVPNTDTVIGQGYTIKVVAQNIYTDADGKNLKSALPATSSPITAATTVNLAVPAIAADGKSISFGFTPNGSTIENMIVFAALDDGSDKFYSIPSASLATATSPIVVNSSAGQLNLTAAQKIVSGLVVLTDTTANGIKFTQF
jgi:hypothetical protein